MEHQTAQHDIPALDQWAKDLGDIGWFIPPFVQMGVLDQVVKAARATASFGQSQLEAELIQIYRPISLAAMLTERYVQAAVIQDYAVTIGEAIEAHVLGLDHLAVGGLVPVIEGAGRRLAVLNGLSGDGHLKVVFGSLIEACKSQAQDRKLGTVGEVLSMLDSFGTFLDRYLYAGSSRYPLADKTNRHGIAHGAYDDADYGRPINFYKTIAAIDFLTFVSTFVGGGSWMAPPLTPRALLLARSWLEQRATRDARLGRTLGEPMATELSELRDAASWLATLPLDDAMQL
ncbi:hypothetical protein OVA11_19490 [Caulobacter sp. SL161]|uniref:hypothetical protein n=1 Tax=Caulobacter sp. SL161 TaxID=2995156 RepID=UPI0022744218|nr:hypothetical protein [Caulobacter sp. SL161]MCY1649162.1 hypothetical protein [Caulobacter sp. SL161]